MDDNTSVKIMYEDLREQASTQFNEDELAKGLRIGVRNGEIKPVYCGSAVNCVGIERLLDLITEYFPNYAEKGTVVALDADNEEVLMNLSPL